jgi:hypothetical protein
MTLIIQRGNFQKQEFKNVRYTSLYTTPSADVGPELVIHFDWKECRPQENIPLAEILSIDSMDMQLSVENL